MLLERNLIIVLLGKYTHTHDAAPYGTQGQASTAESPHTHQETQLSSLPAWFLVHLFILVLKSLWFFQAHGNTKTALSGMAHEFKGDTPESQLKFQNSWGTSDKAWVRGAPLFD